MISLLTFPIGWNKYFFFLWFSQVFSLFGISLTQFCLVWYLTQMTGSATLLTTSSMVALFPQVLIGPIAGTLIDRVNRKNVMILANGFSVATALTLILLFWLGQIEIWHLFFTLFIRFTALIFYYPAVQASTSLMVPRESLSKVMGWTLTVQGIIGVIAPAMGALLLGHLPVQIVLTIDVTSSLCTFLLLTILKVPKPANHLESSLIGFDLAKNFKDGLRYIVGWRGLRWVVAIAVLFHLFFVPAFALKPLLVTRHFHGNVYQIGLLDAVLNTGVFLGGVILGIWGGFRNKVITSLAGLILTGAGLAMIGSAPGNAFRYGLAGMLVVGLMKPMIGGPLTALIQSTVEPEMQGRVLSIFNSCCQGIAPLSLLIAGPFSDRYGIPLIYIIGGVFCLVIGLIGFLIPDLMKLGQWRVFPPSASWKKVQGEANRERTMNSF
jgi:MFS transporter, DHA3 family, macrolide efflux protein